MCQLVSYLDCSPPGSGHVSEPGLDHTEPVGVGLGPPCSLTDGPGLGGCTHAILTLTLSRFLLQLCALTESRARGGGLSLELFWRRSSFPRFSDAHAVSGVHPLRDSHSQSLHTSAQSPLVRSVEAFLFLS